MHVGEMLIGKPHRDLLKSANTAFVRHKTFSILSFDCLSLYLLIVGDLNVAR